MRALVDFAPLISVAARETPSGDAAHDFAHVRRVLANALRIAAGERVALHILVPAVLLHEIFNFPKNHPDSARSGEVCAEKTRSLLSQLAYATADIEAIAHAIAIHPFSRGITPETLEARILQDADRLDALGAIGIARCFATGATMGARFYADDDPFCRSRAPDDKAHSVDHFYRKLLRLPETLHTAAARRLAEPRVAFMRAYLAQLASELDVDVPASAST